MKTLYGYFVAIPIWIIGFIATTIFLIIDFIVAKFMTKFKKVSNTPYFKTRSIYKGCGK